MAKKHLTHKAYLITLLLCLLQVAGIDVYAQEPVKVATRDSVIVRQPPKAHARRHRDNTPTLSADSLASRKSAIQRDSITVATMDSITLPPIRPSVADSLEKINKQNLAKIEAKVALPQPADTVAPTIPQKTWTPNPTKATWLAVVFPGGGQIYNRKFWKLPIIYGGFVGCAYALNWNTKTYKDYSRAYLDAMDKDPNTKSYENFLPPNYTASEAQLQDVLRRQKDTFRRYRDLSIFAFIGVYLISIVDAYVDAELSDFDITPDLSMRVEPTVINDLYHKGNKSVGVQCSLRF